MPHKDPDVNRQYMRRYMLDRYNRRKEEAIQFLGGVCVDCGTTNMLEFDHIEPTTKSFVIGKKLSSVSKEKLKEELEKCQLLCKTCHDEKHYNNGGVT